MATIDPGELFPGHVPGWCHSNWETSIIHSTCMEQLLLICHKDNPRIRMCLSESWTIIFMSSSSGLILSRLMAHPFICPQMLFLFHPIYLFVVPLFCKTELCRGIRNCAKKYLSSDLFALWFTRKDWINFLCVISFRDCICMNRNWIKSALLHFLPALVRNRN